MPEDKYWGAQTARSLIHFSIGEDKMARALIRALGIIKKASARVNESLGKLPKDKSELILKASEEVVNGRLDDHFP